MRPLSSESSYSKTSKCWVGSIKSVTWTKIWPFKVLSIGVTSRAIFGHQGLSKTRFKYLLQCLGTSSRFWYQRKFERNSRSIFNNFFSEKNTIFFICFFSKIVDMTLVIIAYCDLDHINVICMYSCVWSWSWKTPCGIMWPLRKWQKVPMRVNFGKKRP